ncbi:terminase family protein [Desulfovibrio legallii]|jgi:hypothetical protein|uniref:Uncharacterized protein n=1 Tax=Desulfovibrio legallii TaxID=571438 RepID=A0A6H3F4Q1_9BACT|nr:terminase family protein [Desulfovibrio legallii]TBH79533.1 hypothetical protein EB812_08045 [Desulfovibrio legallii]DAZ80367.1 MAG TPA: large terminase [Caudoviricetes sp.]
MNGRIIIPYHPRPLQQAVHDGRKRMTVLLTHRRFGKTVCMVNDLIRSAVLRGNTLRAWRGGYLAPFLKQAKDVAWDFLKYYAGVLPGVRFNETELRADFSNGARIRLYGADNADALRGQYLDDVVLDEAANISRSVWTLNIRPMLADRQGRYAFTGTPQGMNNLLYDVYEEALELSQAEPEQCALFVYPASKTGYVPPEELEKARASMGDAEYLQEFECSFAAAVRGAYWAREIDALEQLGRVTSVPIAAQLPVNTAWDLGMDDATAIWFFQVEPSGTWRIVDFYEASGEGLEHYARMLREKGYAYGRHIGPHDIMVRELGTGKSRYETARDMGIRFAVCRNLPVIDGVDAVRRQLPRCVFDAGRCAPGIKALRQYRKSFNARLDVFGRPVHDWTSHAADAFRYAVVGMMPERQEPRQERTGVLSRG